MSVGSQIIDRFGPPTRLLPSTLERQLRELRIAGFVPTAGRGGGKSSVHYESDHLAHVMLSLAAFQPSDGPEAVQKLDRLPYVGSENLAEGMKPPAHHLGTVIVEMIEGLGRPFSKGLELSAESLAHVRTWELVLCLSPPAAQIMVGSDEKRTTHFFADPPTLDPGLRRLTVLSGAVWLAAGALLADTIVQHNAIAMIKFLGRTKPAKAYQEDENAGDPRQRVPAPSTDDPRGNGDEAYSLPNSLDRSASNGSSDQFATCEAGGFRNHRDGICEVKSLQGCTQRELVALL